MTKIGICFWIHVCKRLNEVNRGFFSNEEIRDYAMTYESAYRNGDRYIISSIIDELSTYGDYTLDTYVSRIRCRNMAYICK